MDNNNLASALAKAQSEMLIAEETGYNPHFKSSFSTLKDLIKASRPALTKYGLSVTQYPDSQDGYNYLVTKIKHASGQEDGGRALILLKDPTDVQKYGSAISYIKRYAYASICGLATSEGDDDGNTINDIRPTQISAPESKSDYISSKQAYWLKQVMAKTEGLEEKVLKAYGIPSMEQFPWRKVKELKEKLGIVDDKE